jgi:hypothetical protein
MGRRDDEDDNFAEKLDRRIENSRNRRDYDDYKDRYKDKYYYSYDDKYYRYKRYDRELSGLTIFILIIIWIWIITGALGFIASLVCFGFNGTMSDKFLGLLLVLVLGPFYWLYYIFNSNYCTRWTPVE